MAVYDALHAAKSHPTAEELYRAVKPRILSLSLATVYNTLEALCKVGLVHKLPTNNGSCRYDADTREHLHISFRDTAEIKDVPTLLSCRLIQALPRSVLEEIEQEMGVRIDGVSVQLFAHRASVNV
jgi:Fe2+ or Zn2+ uptake regulation protein